MNLVNLYIPESLDGYPVTKIGSYAFDNCDTLTSVVIPDSVISIGNSAFDSCGKLTKVSMGKNVTKIGAFVFANCQELTSVSCHNRITTIGEYAFCNTTKLKDIYYQGSQKQWGNILVGTENTYWRLAYVHCCNVSVEKFYVSGMVLIKVNTHNIPIGSQIVLSCYQGDKLSYVEPVTKLAEEDTYYFIPAGDYTTSKVMVFANFDNLSPVIEPVFVE